jgi:hypothetical protein
VPTRSRSETSIYAFARRIQGSLVTAISLFQMLIMRPVKRISRIKSRAPQVRGPGVLLLPSTIPLKQDLLRSFNCPVQSWISPFPWGSSPTHEVTRLSIWQREQKDGNYMRLDKNSNECRTRAVLAAVEGNNRTGRKGKLICTACRKIRSKVHSAASRQS